MPLSLNSSFYYLLQVLATFTVLSSLLSPHFPLLPLTPLLLGRPTFPAFTGICSNEYLGIPSSSHTSIAVVAVL